MGQDLAHKRPWLLASLFFGLTYYFRHSAPIGEIWIMAWKAAACLCLAAYALHHHNKGDFRHFAAIMAISGIADAVVNIDLIQGGTIFALAHIVAIAFYAKHRRPKLTPSQSALGIMLPVANVVITYSVTQDPLHAAYGLVSGIMAGMAWTSSFPRYRVGVGVVLFLISDLMIFTGIGSSEESALPRMTIWLVYYFAQFLIAIGVVQTLVKRSHMRTE